MFESNSSTDMIRITSGSDEGQLMSIRDWEKLYYGLPEEARGYLPEVATVKADTATRTKGVTVGGMNPADRNVNATGEFLIRPVDVEAWMYAGHFDRSIKPVRAVVTGRTKNSVSNNVMSIEQDFQRLGLATRLIERQDSVFPRLGVDRNTVETAEAGTSVWGKMGFDIDRYDNTAGQMNRGNSSSSPQWLDNMETYGLDEEYPDLYASIRAFKDGRNPGFSIQDIMNNPESSTIFRGSGWYGEKVYPKVEPKKSPVERILETIVERKKAKSMASTTFSERYDQMARIARGEEKLPKPSLVERMLDMYKNSKFASDRGEADINPMNWLRRGSKLSEKDAARTEEVAALLKASSAEAGSKEFAGMPVTELGELVKTLSGHSSIIPGVNGVYKDALGKLHVLKGHNDAASAYAEARGSQLTRDLFGLETPDQQVIKLKHPITGDQMFGVRSTFDEKFAEPTGKFTDEEFYKQAVASILRRDKDLQAENLYGNVVADQGQAFVTNKASQPRVVGGLRLPVGDQVRANFLMDKAGAKAWFAETTANIAKRASSSEYSAGFQKVIDDALENFDGAMAKLGKLSPEEEALYKTLKQDLVELSGTDWSAVQAHHAQIVPKVAKPKTEAAIKKAAEAKEARKLQAQESIDSGMPEWLLPMRDTLSARKNAMKSRFGDDSGEFDINPMNWFRSIKNLITGPKSLKLSPEEMNSMRMEEIYARRGLGGKPVKTVSSEKFDKLQSSGKMASIYRGWFEAERGTKLENLLRSFVENESLFPAGYKGDKAINGRAPYFADGLQRAKNYASRGGQDQFFEPTTAVTKALIKRRSKIITDDELKALMAEKYPEVDYKANRSAEYASALGYDFLRARGMNTVVLNKRRLIMEQPTFDISTNSYYSPEDLEKLGLKFGNNPVRMNIPGLKVGGMIQHDNTLANLHEGEIVLTKPLTNKLTSGIEKMNKLFPQAEEEFPSFEAGAAPKMKSTYKRGAAKSSALYDSTKDLKKLDSAKAPKKAPAVKQSPDYPAPGQVGEISETIHGDIRSVSGALSYLLAEQKSGSTAWRALCESLARHAYGLGGSYRSAKDHFEAIPKERIIGKNTATAPKGALGFWDPRGHNFGHIATSTGDGSFYTNLSDGRVGKKKASELNTWGPILGVTDPWWSNDAWVDIRKTIPDVVIPKPKPKTLSSGQLQQSTGFPGVPGGQKSMHLVANDKGEYYYHSGGPVAKLRSDEVRAVLQQGEYVINKNAAANIGSKALGDLNSGRGVANNNTNHYNVSVQGTPGMDVNALASAVISKIETKERRKGVARR